MIIENINSPGSSAEHITFFIILQILIILFFSRIISSLARRYLGQTNVAGEILAGILLGPSFLASLFPETFHMIFIEDTAIVFTGLSQIGLIFLMFQIGMEFNFSLQLKGAGRSFIVISIAGIAIPFLIGYISAGYIWQQLPAPAPPEEGFRLFFAVAMSITAIPILGRIFMELNYSNTRIAALVISAAAVDDVIGWLLLGIITALVTTGFDFPVTINNLILLISFIFISLIIGSRFISPWIAKKIATSETISPTLLFTVISGLFINSLATSFLGVYAIIGGFIFGLSLHKNRKFVQRWNETIGYFVNIFFLPLFFAWTGLKTNIGLLTTLPDILLCLAICFLAFIGKFGGTYLASRLTGEKHNDALIVGFSMNTRALMELIVLNVGYDLGILPQKIFTMLVVMAVSSTFIITPILKYLLKKNSRHVLFTRQTSAKW